MVAACDDDAFTRSKEAMFVVEKLPDNSTRVKIDIVYRHHAGEEEEEDISHSLS